MHLGRQYDDYQNSHELMLLILEGKIFNADNANGCLLKLTFAGIHIFLIFALPQVEVLLCTTMSGIVCISSIYSSAAAIFLMAHPASKIFSSTQIRHHKAKSTKRNR